MKFFKNKKDKIDGPQELADTWEFIASGVVQGVGFRWSVQTAAQELDLKGTVQNNPDLTVTIRLQGKQSEMDNFLVLLPQKISPFAKISKIDTKYLGKVEKMHGFHVLY